MMEVVVLAIGAQPVPQGLSLQMMPTSGELVTARRRLHRKAVFIALLSVAAYGVLVFAPVPFVVRVLAGVGLVLACVAAATNVMHDANHGVFTRSHRLNNLFGYTSDLLGGSSFLWRFKHNRLHHGNTNVVGFDDDINQSVLARFAPQQRWRPWHRFQHVYMWFLYGFLTLRWLLLADFATIARGKVGDHRLPKPLRARDVALIVLGKLLHVTWAVVIPMLRFPWWGVVAFYLCCSWLVGFLLANIFQLAHCVDQAEFFEAGAPRRGADFERHQLRTTVDIRSPLRPVRAFLHWLMGGLDYQIEHHLAPKLPHTVYPIIAPRLEAACRAAGVEYKTHRSLVAALRSHGRWLRDMGRAPATA